MSDDLELGRVRRRLDALASAVEPPDHEELARMARAASSTRRAAIGFRRPLLPAAAAVVAASAAVAALAVVGLRDGSGDRSGRGTGTTSLVSFPEGSAIRLLTSSPQGESR